MSVDDVEKPTPVALILVELRKIVELLTEIKEAAAKNNNRVTVGSGNFQHKKGRK